MTTIQEAFGKDCFYIQGVRTPNGRGLYTLRNPTKGVIIQKTEFEVTSDENLNDICKDLGIDWVGDEK